MHIEKTNRAEITQWKNIKERKKKKRGGGYPFNISQTDWTETTGRKISGTRLASECVQSRVNPSTRIGFIKT